MRPIKKDSTDQSTVIRIIDASDGTPETAVEHDTAGIDLWYRREGATKTSITEAALGSLDAAHSDGGIEHIGDGYYRLDLPDAAVATGANGVMVGGAVTDMIVIGAYHPLVDYDPYDSVRMGMTALPSAAADAAGGLPVSDAGGLDLDTQLAEANEITAARMGALTDWIDGGRLDLLLDAIKAVTDAESGVKAAVDALNDFDPNNDAVANVTLVDTTTTNTDMRGTDNAALASVLGALNDAAAAGEVTDADTLVQYIKQIINVLIGTPGIGTFPAEAAPGDGVSLAEVVRAIHADVTGLNGDAMRGTDSAALASVCTEGRLAELDAANLPADIDAVLADTNELQTDDVPGLIAALNDPTAAAIADAVWDEEETGHVDAGKAGAQLWTDVDAILADTNELQGDLADGGRLDSILDELTTQGDTNEGKLDTIDGVVDAVLEDTDDIGVAGAGLTAIPWNASWDAEVQSEVQDAIEANHLDHLLAADYDPASKPGVATALLNELVEDDAGVSRFTANALEQAPSGGAAAADIADAVLDEVVSEHTGAGSLGKIIADILEDTDDIGIAGAGLSNVPWNASWDSEVQSEVEDALGAGGANLNALPWNAAWDSEIQSEVEDALGAGGVNLNDIPWNADWDAEVQSGCADALAAYDPPTKAELDTAFTEIKGGTWDSLTDTLEHIRDKESDIETDTQDLQTQIGAAGAGLSDVPWNADWDAEVESEVEDALIAYDPPTRTELTSDKNAIIAEVDANEAKIDIIDDYLDTEIAAILADTNEIQTDLTDGGRLDLLIDAVKAKTDNLPASPAAVGSEMALENNAITAAKIATGAIDADALAADAVDEILDEEVDNDGTAISLRGAMKLVLSILTAKTSGGGTATLVFRDVGDSKNRLSVTVDADGNRTAVGTRDAS